MKKKIIVTLVIVGLIASMFTVHMFAGGNLPIPIPTDPTIVDDKPVTNPVTNPDTSTELTPEQINWLKFKQPN
jgi:hypothetical protein